MTHSASFAHEAHANLAATATIAEDPRPLLDVWTRGRCRPNPGQGGWCYIVVKVGDDGEGSKPIVRTGTVEDTTNQKMELTAALEMLQATKRLWRIRMHSASTYLIHGITAWIPAWEQRGGKTAGGETPGNLDLWRELKRLSERHSIEWVLVPDHAEDAMNERADTEVTKAIRRASRDSSRGQA